MAIKKSNQLRNLFQAIMLAIFLTGSAHGFVANPDRCSGCHAEQHRFWEGTLHSSAYLVLFSKNSHADPDCVRCHTLGLNAPRGFSYAGSPLALSGRLKNCGDSRAPIECLMEAVMGKRPAPLDSSADPKRFSVVKNRYHRERKKIADQVRKDFMNVQCEHCHGDREAHLESGQRMTPVIKEATCRQCHTPERDPLFKFEKVKLVSCPRMKK